MNREEFEKERDEASDDHFSNYWKIDQEILQEYIIQRELGANWAYDYRQAEVDELNKKIELLKIKLKLSDERALRTYDGMAEKADKYDELKVKLDVAEKALGFGAKLIHFFPETHQFLKGSEAYRLQSLCMEIYREQRKAYKALAEIKGEGE